MPREEVIDYYHDGGPFKSTVIIKRDLKPEKLSYALMVEFTDATDYERVLHWLKWCFERNRVPKPDPESNVGHV